MPARGSRVRQATAVGLTCVLLAGAAAAQRRGLGGGPRYEPVIQSVPYDGRFTFARVKYLNAPSGYWFRGIPSWAHGYPVSEDNLLRITNEVSLLNSRVDGYNVLTLDDPELCRYPVAYLTEAGWWTLTEPEVAGFRAYLLKGGFAIFDDFKVPGQFGMGGGGWDTFAANMQRVIPGARFVDLDPANPVFHSFFEIKSLADFPQAYNVGRPIFRGLYEDNDPRRRLMLVVNYNTDISQYWEWSGRGLRPFDQTNEAYKLGVNYLIYGLTH